MNTEKKKVRAVLYIRVATESQLADNIGISAQSARLRQQAEREGFEIASEVRAYEKGVTLDRPGWHDALRIASKERADMVMVTNLDRVARGLPLAIEALADLEKRELKLYSCSGELPFTRAIGQAIL